MKKAITASSIIGKGVPTEEGERLATALLARKSIDWADLEIDVSDLPASLLISAFFNAFLQRVWQDRHDLLDLARGTKWSLAYAFQRENVARWMTDFAPVKKHAPQFAHS